MSAAWAEAAGCDDTRTARLPCDSKDRPPPGVGQVGLALTWTKSSSGSAGETALPLPSFVGRHGRSSTALTPAEKRSQSER
jgi:hypothetical protein